MRNSKRSQQNSNRKHNNTSHTRQRSDIELSSMNNNSTISDDRGPLLGNDNSNSNNSMEDNKKPPNMVRIQCCAITSVAGFIILSFIATYILADSEGKHLILDREDTKEARQHKALHVFIAAGMYLVLGIYNCFLWKKSDNTYNNGPGYQALD